MIPLILYLEWFGIAISCLIYAITMFYALRIEKFKKQHNLRTFRQIVAYDQGRSLSEIEEAEGKGQGSLPKYYPSCSILPWNWSYCSVVFLALTDFLPYQIKAKSSDLAFKCL